jgi:hypothetical protein
MQYSTKKETVVIIMPREDIEGVGEELEAAFT